MDKKMGSFRDRVSRWLENLKPFQTRSEFWAALRSLLSSGFVWSSAFSLDFFHFEFNFKASQIDLFMFGDYQTSILGSIFSARLFSAISVKQHQRRVCTAHKNIISFRPICSASYAPVWDKFDKYFSIWNKAVLNLFFLMYAFDWSVCARAMKYSTLVGALPSLNPHAVQLGCRLSGVSGGTGDQVGSTSMCQFFGRKGSEWFTV